MQIGVWHAELEISSIHTTLCVRHVLNLACYWLTSESSIVMFGFKSLGGFLCATPDIRFEMQTDLVFISSYTCDLAKKYFLAEPNHDEILRYFWLGRFHGLGSYPSLHDH